MKAQERATEKKVLKKLYDAKRYQQKRTQILAQCNAYRRNPEVRERNKVRLRKEYAARREEIQAKRKARLEANPDVKARYRANEKKHYQAKKFLYTAKVAKRRAIKETAMPIWAKSEKIKEFYKIARQRTAETGIQHVVDHIVPLQGETVCGLHVENNLQVISALENAVKANKLILP